MYILKIAKEHYITGGKMKIIKREDKEFPIKLLEVKPIIKQIYVEGNEKILNNFGIAVIGSRNSSREGERITDEFVSKLSKFGINIIIFRIQYKLFFFKIHCLHYFY